LVADFGFGVVLDGGEVASFTAHFAVDRLAGQGAGAVVPGNVHAGG
jgi:hypothetical protein